MGGRAIRIWAVLAAALLTAFYVLRAVAQDCSGAACDIYIPLSLLLPASVLVAAAVTAVLALIASRREHSWFSGLALAAVISVFGPLIALGVLRDQPDAVVPSVTLLFLILPAAALVYSFSRR